MGLRPAEIAVWLGRLLVALSLVGIWETEPWSARAAEPGTHPTSEQLEHFEKHVRPILAEHCYSCHSAEAESLQGGLLLDRRPGVIEGGDSGPAVVPGKPEESRLIEAVRWTDPDLQMPPRKKLPDEAIAALVAWVRDGAAWPNERHAAAAGEFDLARRRAEHWCWQPPRAVDPPEVNDTDWPAGSVDRFLLARLEEVGLRPAPPADKYALIRRATFLLTGLPPTHEEIESFVRDSSPDAFAKVVDRLLASPHFGERWARHWLDLVRYAESRGHEFDPTIPGAWQYRDYVVRALNADVPYHQFVREHIAGDLIPPRLGPGGENESMLGTGFWLLGEEVHSPVDIRQDEADRIDNRLDVMGKTFLGLTIGCARCHDHKFDAISQRDYYALTGFVVSASYRQARYATYGSDRRIAEQLDALRAAARPQLRQAVAEQLAAAAARLPGWLEAAAEVLHGAELSEVAAARELDARALGTWVDELKQALDRPADPLFALALAAQTGRSEEFERQLGELVSQSTGPPSQSPASGTKGSGGEVVIDYALAPPEHWLQDGWGFGLRPARPGDFCFSLEDGRPIVGLATRGCAQRDPAWAGLTGLGPEKDHGRLGDWQRAGQTLRTPEGHLGSGRLWYLVRGSGRAYAAVNNHLIIAGPLHGALLSEWEGEPGEWHWVEHDLRAYRGHRYHLEFSPRDAADFALARVIDSDTPPPPPGEPNPLLIAALSDTKPASSGDVAGALQRACLESARLLADGQTDRPGVVELADWLLRRLDRLLPADVPESRDFLEATRPFSSKQAELAAQIVRAAPTAPVMFEGSGTEAVLLVRGSARTPREQVPRRFLEALAGDRPLSISPGSGRLELAEALTADDNPLLDRVIVNRVWHHLFGRGLVANVDNFGVLGERPSHPELLDWLAVHFRRDLGGSLKALVRELVLARAWQMSSAAADPRAAQLDPDNRLLHRAQLRRLEGEAIRDAVLLLSGRLDRTLGGPSTPVHLTEFMEGRGRPESGPLDGAGRRSLYLSVRRNFLSPFMLAFDTPIPFTTIGRRHVSNVPAQQLMLMNDPFVAEQARRWGARHAACPPEVRIERMYLEALARPPEAAELRAALEFFRSQGALYGLSPEAALDDPRVSADFAHALWNVKEFIHVR